MTIYTVVWHEDALADLAGLWTAAQDRQAITDAVLRVDRVLRNDPNSKGVDFYGDRLLIASPLAVIYTIREHDRLAEVLSAIRVEEPRL